MDTDSILIMLIAMFAGMGIAAGMIGKWASNPKMEMYSKICGVIMIVLIILFALKRL